MKITKTQLKQIIAEELAEASGLTDFGLSLMSDDQREGLINLRREVRRLLSIDVDPGDIRSIMNDALGMNFMRDEFPNITKRKREEEDPISRGFEGWASRSSTAKGAE